MVLVGNIMPSAYDQVMHETIAVLRRRCLGGAWNSTLAKYLSTRSPATLSDTKVRDCFFRFFCFDSVLLTIFNCCSRLSHLFVPSTKFLRHPNTAPYISERQEPHLVQAHYSNSTQLPWHSNGSHQSSRQPRFDRYRQMAAQ